MPSSTLCVANRWGDKMDARGLVFCVVFISFLIFCAGCSQKEEQPKASEPEAKPVAPQKNEKPKMSASDAKSALVELVETTDDTDLKFFLDRLKKAEPKELTRDQIPDEFPVPEGVIVLDAWRCDLHKNTFVLSVISKPIFLAVSGHFEFSDGKWIAKIDRKRQS
jgi:hypothetical protein